MTVAIVVTGSSWMRSAVTPQQPSLVAAWQRQVSLLACQSSVPAEQQ